MGHRLRGETGARPFYLARGKMAPWQREVAGLSERGGIRATHHLLNHTLGP